MGFFFKRSCPTPFHTFLLSHFCLLVLSLVFIFLKTSHKTPFSALLHSDSFLPCRLFYLHFMYHNPFFYVKFLLLSLRSTIAFTRVSAHVLQDCLNHQLLRRDFWPEATTMQSKLYVPYIVHRRSAEDSFTTTGLPVSVVTGERKKTCVSEFDLW